jgi:hypothetical protein
LDGIEDSRLEWLWKPRVHCTSLRKLTLKSLEVVEIALASDFTLEMFGSVERHTCSIFPEHESHDEHVYTQGEICP